MAMVPLLADDDVAPTVRPIFAAVEEAYGFVPNILRAMAHDPDLLTDFVPLWVRVYRSEAVGPRLRALLALGTAKAQDCSYCMAHMTASARRAGIPQEQIDAVGEVLQERRVFDEREGLILELADALTRDPDGVTDEMRGRLLGVFHPEEIVTIVLGIGMYNLTSRFLKALSIEVEDLFAGPPVPSSATTRSQL